jgi:uncharacterized protein YecE (DUF72 family)
MEFGRVDTDLLNGLDLRLPPEPAANAAVLTDKASEALKIYAGCPRWGAPGWTGRWYPHKTKDKDFLEQYVKQFNCIELNATHYKVYAPEQIAKWAAKAEGRNFLFCPKLYKGITHQGSLDDKLFLLEEFLTGIGAFQQHLGPLFIQLSDSFAPLRKDELFRFVEQLPGGYRFFLELRHPDWFAVKPVWNAVLEKMRLHNIGLVITDTPGRRDCAHMHLTLPAAMIRYVGNNLHPTDYTRIDEWVKRIGLWMNSGLQELYFFMHMHEELKAPELTAYFIERLNQEYHLNVQPPRLLHTGPEMVQGGLFD